MLFSFTQTLSQLQQTVPMEFAIPNTRAKAVSLRPAPIGPHPENDDDGDSPEMMMLAELGRCLQLFGWNFFRGRRPNASMQLTGEFRVTDKSVVSCRVNYS